MPSTIVHLAVAALIAAALLGEAYDKKAVLIVLAVTAVPDLDSFIALVSTAGHRTALHTVWIPVVGALLLFVDVRVRDRSLVVDRWGHWGVRVAWVSIVAYLVAHVLLDMTDGVANLFWPIHDQFYTLRGSVELSDRHGIVQTIFATEGTIPTLEATGSTEDTEITTGVDPGSGQEERVFPIFGAGWQLLISVVGTAVALARFKVPHELPKRDS